ncbi:MAG: hypothetical protein WD557_18725, partial [Dehalococcoidia bacterium]
MPRTYKSKTGRQNRSTKPQDLPAKWEPGFLSSLDGRTELARALRANRQAIVEDIGGDVELSHVKNALVERFVWLEGILQTIEHEMASGVIEKDVALGRWIQGLNALSGLAKALGTERKAVTRPWANVVPESTDAASELEDKSRPSIIAPVVNAEPEPAER